MAGTDPLASADLAQACAEAWEWPDDAALREDLALSARHIRSLIERLPADWDASYRPAFQFIPPACRTSDDGL